MVRWRRHNRQSRRRSQERPRGAQRYARRYACGHRGNTQTFDRFRMCHPRASRARVTIGPAHRGSRTGKTRAPARRLRQLREEVHRAAHPAWAGRAAERRVPYQAEAAAWALRGRGHLGPDRSPDSVCARHLLRSEFCTIVVVAGSSSSARASTAAGTPTIPLGVARASGPLLRRARISAERR